MYSLVTIALLAGYAAANPLPSPAVRANNRAAPTPTVTELARRQDLAPLTACTLSTRRAFTDYLPPTAIGVASVSIPYAETIVCDCEGGAIAGVNYWSYGGVTRPYCATGAEWPFTVPTLAPRQDLAPLTECTVSIQSATTDFFAPTAIGVASASLAYAETAVCACEGGAIAAVDYYVGYDGMEHPYCPTAVDRGFKRDAPPVPTLVPRQDLTPLTECAVSTQLATTDTIVAGTLTTTATYAETLVCNCEGEAVAAVYTSVGDDGADTMYCATATVTSGATAVATSVSTGTAGDANNEAWADIACDFGSLESINNNPQDQWNDAGAAAAWDTVVEKWNNEVDEAIKAKGFSTYVGDYFHARPNLACQTLDNENCARQGITEPNAPVSAPAGYVIINSMVNLHILFENVYNGVRDAHDMVQDEVGNLVREFSPIIGDIAEQKAKRLAWDTIQLALFIALAPTFHSVMGRSALVRANPNWAATGIDVSYGAIGTGFAFAKDAMDALSPLPVQNQVSSYMGDIITGWETGLSGMTNLLFSDPTALGTLISDGKLFGLDVQRDPVDVQAVMEQNLFAALLPTVWTTGDDFSYPVVILPEGVPQDGTGCEGLRPMDVNTTVVQPPDVSGTGLQLEPDAPYLELQVGEPAFFDGFHCDVQTNTGYWLMGALGDYRPDTCCRIVDRNQVCSDCPTGRWVAIRALRGIGTLDGNNWGGLSKEEVIMNAVNTYKKNGNTNGGAPGANMIESSEGIADLISGDLRVATGLINIPVCSMQQILDTITADKDNSAANPNYPCPP
ncbi:hypothetical protein LTR37_006488 [Vermiconidia calcicola]|uniref:Uncharacterized protein n=1 Tax=Vermiconidia calcicola TaxID=1690605 RepID=A0ACC3NGL6_9PEZI|nr:hypothetical protein LTR37_006488 [Vermiconidia calcicola]